MTTKLLAFLSGVLLCVNVNFATANDGASSRFIKGKLFFPELVIENQEKLNLSKTQKKLIKHEIQTAQQEVNELKWNQKKFAEKVSKTIAAHPVTETEALSNLNQMLIIENDIKMLHLKLMIRIKNALSAEQVNILRKL